ncbi:MAG TPA: glycosyltransferase family 4 protein [Candidatus Limnocylindrales bacterium]|nr:glycosyltransferase family 4 protein [Candidatus Limnocylindrales bacterium]
MSAAARRLRVALVAPPLERVPPKAYGGTERIVHELATQLVRRGHEVTVFASGDSDVPGRHITTVPRALRPANSPDDVGNWFGATVDAVLRRRAEFDLIHSHLEWWSIPLARAAGMPVAATFHGRLDLPYSRQMLVSPPDGLVAVSRNQASTHPSVPWTVVHNGLTLDGMPFQEARTEGFCFVGRVDPEKGIIEAIEVAKRTGRPLRIAAKVGMLPYQRDYHENVFLPALRSAGSGVEYLGELAPPERDRLFAESYATLMPGSWPEPFGLVAIESLSCGTPIVARRIGALPEIIREGVDGVFGDDVMQMAFMSADLDGVDRRAIRERVIERFSAARMTDRYEELYARLVARPRMTADRLRASVADSGAATSTDRAGSAAASDGRSSGDGRSATGGFAPTEGPSAPTRATDHDTVRAGTVRIVARQPIGRNAWRGSQRGPDARPTSGRAAVDDRSDDDDRS